LGERHLLEELNNKIAIIAEGRVFSKSRSLDSYSEGIGKKSTFFCKNCTAGTQTHQVHNSSSRDFWAKNCELWGNLAKLKNFLD